MVSGRSGSAAWMSFTTSASRGELSPAARERHELGNALIGRTRRAQQAREHLRHLLVGGGLGDGALVLAVERAAELAQRLGRLLQAGGDGRYQRRQVEVHRKFHHADGAQRIDREQHGFGIGLGAVDADKLGTDLGELAFGLQRTAAHTDDVAAIGEAQRPRLVLQPRHGDARHLHGHVRPHAHHALRNGVHQPEGLRGERRAGTAQQGFLEFDHGRLHAFVTEGRETLDGDIDGAGFAHRIGRQKIGEAGRQKATMVVVV